MAASRKHPKRPAEALAALDLGESIETVARRFKISRRTLTRWRDNDQFRASAHELVQDWRVAGVDFLRVAFQRLSELARDSKDIHAIAGAVKIAAEALTVREALNVSGSSFEGPAPAPDAGEADPDAAAAVH